MFCLQMRSSVVKVETALPTFECYSDFRSLSRERVGRAPIVNFDNPGGGRYYWFHFPSPAVRELQKCGKNKRLVQEVFNTFDAKYKEGEHHTTFDYSSNEHSAMEYTVYFTLFMYAYFAKNDVDKACKLLRIEQIQIERNDFWDIHPVDIVNE